MIYRVVFNVTCYNVYADFNTLCDAAVFAEWLRLKGKVDGKPFEDVSIRFIEETETKAEESETPEE